MSTKKLNNKNNVKEENLTDREKIENKEEMKNKKNSSKKEIKLEEKNEVKKEKENEKEEFIKEDIEQNKYVAAFSYLSILFIVPLFLKRDSLFCQKQAKQGLVWFAFLIITSFCYFIPLLNIFYALLVLFITFYCFFKTLAGKYWPIPVLSKWAEKINL